MTIVGFYKKKIMYSGLSIRMNCLKWQIIHNNILHKVILLDTAKKKRENVTAVERDAQL